MIPLQYLWQNHNGAAHRKKIDTPSLGWACFEQGRKQPFTRLFYSNLALLRKQLFSFRKLLFTRLEEGL